MLSGQRFIERIAAPDGPGLEGVVDVLDRRADVCGDVTSGRCAAEFLPEVVPGLCDSQPELLNVPRGSDHPGAVAEVAA
jgi:hypothetical protein